jgi:hypothetical protein
LFYCPKISEKQHFPTFYRSKTRIKLQKPPIQANNLFSKHILPPYCPIKLIWASNHNLILFFLHAPLNCLSEVLVMVHKRSFNKLQRRIIRNLIFKNSYMDKYRGEIVSRVSRLDVLGLLNCEGFNVYLIPDIEKGEVLLDSRGKGSLQNAT